MAQQTLTTTIQLNGSVSNTFTTLGDTITSLGAQVDLISQKLIDLGSGSLDTWEAYEKNLTHIKTIMGENFFKEDATGLSNAMTQLDLAMRQWAASTSFDTSEISEATEAAAIGGLDYKEIIDMMPAAMNLALAGEMDLSEATRSLIDVTNAAGLSFEDSMSTVDMWVKAADSADTTVAELASAMKQMGSTMQFAEDFPELLTMLAMLADNGTQASKAGTLLRNTMVKFLAPTSKGTDALESLNGAAAITYGAISALTGKTEELDAALAAETDSQSEYASNAVTAYQEYIDTLSDEELKQELETLMDATGWDEVVAQTFLESAAAAEDTTQAYKDGIVEITQYALELEALNRKQQKILSNEQNLNEYLADSDQWKSYLEGKLGYELTEEQIAEATLNSSYMDKLQYAAEMMGYGGVSAFDLQVDEDGVIRSLQVPMLQAFGNIGIALESMYGENWQNTEGAINSLYSIFMTRGITGAMALAQGALDEHYVQLEDDIREKSSGYGDAVAEGVTESYYGQKKLFESVWENFKLTLGEILAPDVEDVFTGLEDVINAINGMDTNKLTALVSGLEVVAVAGPALLSAGAILKLVGYMMSVPGIIALGAIGIGAAARYFSTLEQENYEDSFGTMAVDTEELEGYITQLGSAFDTAYTDVNNFNDALDTTVAEYESLSATMSSMLLTSMLTNGTLTAADKEKLLGYAESLDDTLLQAIAQSEGMSEAFWTAFFGEDSDNPAYSWAIGLTNSIADEAIAEAQQLSTQMRDALTSAFEDGTISSDEYQEILNYMRAYNDAMARAEAEAASEEDYVSRQKALAKAQNISYEGLETLLTDAAAERDARIAEEYDYYQTQRFKLEYRMRQQIDAAATEEEKAALEAELETQTAAMDEQWAVNKQELMDTYAGFIQTLWYTGLQGNEEALEGIKNHYFPYGKDDEGNLLATTNSLLDTWTTDEAKLGNIAAQYIRLYGDLMGYGPDTADYIYSLMGFNDDGIEEATTDALSTAQATADANPVEIPVTYYIVDKYGNRYPGDTGLEELLTKAGQSYTIEEVAGPGYATGGRATTASIFGEAGAEWAIPERHDSNTASLLMQAAAASGFSWPELASAAASTQTLVYSPTIYAENAAGVDEKLLEDKDRLEKWFRRRELINTISAY